MPKILITGGAGFLGKYVCDEFYQHKYHIGQCQHQFLIKNNYMDGWSIFYGTDFTNKSQTLDIIQSYKPDAIIHLAANVGGIGANQKYPYDFMYNNLLMGMNVLNAARTCNISKVVMLGTVCLYPKNTTVPFQESDIWNGYPESTNAPYGIAKRALGELVKAYNKQYGLNAIFLLPVNLTGPGDNFNLDNGHVIPAMIRKFSEAQQRGDISITLWGTGEATREFLHVKDCARAIRLAYEQYNSTEPINIGTGHEISIKELAEKIANKVGFTGTIIFDRTKPDGQPRRCLDVTKAKQLFGFESTISLDEALDDTITWYNKNRG